MTTLCSPWPSSFSSIFVDAIMGELNVRLHIILYTLVFVSAFVFFIAAICDQFLRFVAFLKCYLVSLH